MKVVELYDNDHQKRDGTKQFQEERRCRKLPQANVVQSVTNTCHFAPIPNIRYLPAWLAW